MRKIDSSFSEMLHVHVDKKHTLSFYTTLNNELAVVSLERKLIGFKLESYVNKTPLITEKEISWQGVSQPNEDIHLLFGTVHNQDTTQIIIVSERNQSANIIRAGSLSFWYILTDESVHTPVTIQTFNKDEKSCMKRGM
ncbi:hypothetical protein J4772_05515 [Cohnella sp. LGH]|uniref:hypothetical protein n=1 Tax=Cohnella sp. LGH TaxID=1619153 RepID=UPI001ADBDD0B|nr:hypothetical protein [Cohnella sp. LGH]QTH43876.1 hypothetical protein J4772_05515 [Cohnella sp. LGH]